MEMIRYINYERASHKNQFSSLCVAQMGTLFQIKCMSSSGLIVFEIKSEFTSVISKVFGGLISRVLLERQIAPWSSARP